uniref:Uncharacterized protein n=1 Tax=Lactuca sativa TaxID=4236 RepID=A0A9R1WWJ8_LACSA|nr:hypothetical protein LSAT_V11C800441690 [Lactuca sativa]
MGSRVHQTMIPYTPSMASPNTTLKLLIDKKTQKVLFAEATKEFVDFLFHIFSLPLGSLIQILGSKQMVGCLGELKESVDSFNQTYLQPGIDKDVIFNPEIAFNGNMFLLLNDAFADDKPATSKTLYRCSFTSRSGYYALDGGYVKDVVTYMVMDNLVVKPMSTISTITLINNFVVNDLSQLEEKTLTFGKDEALKLLKASLMTDQVLTTLLRRDD